MTYARARLWLGISGVGLLVVLAAAAVAAGAPSLLFSSSTVWEGTEPLALSAFIGGFLLVMLPLDLLGGYVLPRRFGRPTDGIAAFIRRWLVGVAVQSALFVLFGTIILAAGRLAGVPGAVAVVGLSGLGLLTLQGFLSRLILSDATSEFAPELDELQTRLAGWGFPRQRLAVVEHTDAGFTGGIVGLPGRETIILPRGWFEALSTDQLAVAVARRVEAIRTGSRTRGLVLAAVWILGGFLLSAWLSSGGVASVAGVVTMICCFTLWAFLGLLVLPTVSRNASYALDARVVRQGVPVQLLQETVESLDRLQDDEPQRPALVETIFHPVPSVNNRRLSAQSNRVGAWHAARMTLFLSWSCLGLLSRAVHCNAGRPELWILLPTD